MKKKGFTLVELLAVIVILAIIAVIAVPIIIGVIKDAKYKAAVESLNGYLDAAEKAVTLNDLEEEEDFPKADSNGCYNLKELDKKIEVKGNRPTGIKDSDKICFIDGEVEEMDEIIISGYNANIENYVRYLDGKKIKGEVTFPKNFAYTGKEQLFTIPYTGRYKLEVWGAQGGNNLENAGLGGYSVGEIYLTMGNKLYINVGGQGGATPASVSTRVNGGYNGGGYTNGQACCGRIYGSGGGATHIATKSGLLSTLDSFRSNILIVAGGGGGGFVGDRPGGSGGSGGGFIGETGHTSNGFGTGTGGTQSSGGSVINWVNETSGLYEGNGLFGQGSQNTDGFGTTGGGGGFYGGAGSFHIDAAGGGSGYIGNSNLTNKVMYMYCTENCTDYSSTDESTKTNITTNASNTPTSNYAKKGHGYARINYLGN